MKLTTEYRIFFLRANQAPMAEGQIVLALNLFSQLQLPYSFASEAEAVAWVENNGPEMSRAGEFVILPVYRMR